MGLVSITVMIVGGRLILSGGMTIGDFFAFTLYLGFMVAPVFQAMNIGTQITEAFAGLDRMHEVLEEQPEDVDPQRVVELDGVHGRVQFDHVTFEYDPGKPVLRDVTLEAPPGTVTAGSKHTLTLGESRNRTIPESQIRNPKSQVGPSP
jgi:subfamily B ATP-binding cassette protein MsbA